MSEEPKPPESVGQLTVQERAVRAFGQEERETELIALASKTVDIKTITNADGYEQVRAARIVLKNERVDLEKRGKEAREDATKFSAAVIAEQKRLVALVSSEEDRLQAIEDAWKAKIEAEKQAKIDAEIARVRDLQDRVEELRGCQTLTPSSGSELIRQHIDDLDAIPIDGTFEEFQDQAAVVKEAGLKRLSALWTAARTHEAEQERLAAERAELARLRAEEAERARIAEDDRLAREAEARAERDAEAARLAETNRIERERIAAERAENDRIARERQEELDRQAEQQRRANAEETGRIAAARAQLERDQSTVHQTVEPKPEPTVAPISLRTIKRPTADELVACVSEHFKVSSSMAELWLRNIKWEKEAA